MSRADGSYMYSFPMILDDEGIIWGGAPYSNDEHGLGGTSTNDDQWTNGGRNDTQGAMEDNEMFRTIKRIDIPSTPNLNFMKSFIHDFSSTN